MELEGMDGMGRKMCRGNMEMKEMIGSGRNCWKWKELLLVEGIVDIGRTGQMETLLMVLVVVAVGGFEVDLEKQDTLEYICF